MRHKCGWIKRTVAPRVADAHRVNEYELAQLLDKPTTVRRHGLTRGPSR